MFRTADRATCPASQVLRRIANRSGSPFAAWIIALTAALPLRVDFADCPGEAYMADVLKPEAFNERFTVYLNAEGKPVERTVREMTAGEVLKALEWLGEEIARCSTMPLNDATSWRKRRLTG